MYHTHRKGTDVTDGRREALPYIPASRGAAAHAPPQRGVWTFALAALCAILACFALNAAPALASITHLYDPATTAKFGSTPGTIGVAIDQSNGDVYVAELNGNSVHKFNAAGEPVSSFGAGTGAISFPSGAWGVAVDQTSHDFYVSNGGNAVYKFDSEGNAVASFGAAGQLAVHNCIGVAVDPTNGDLFVANTGGKVEVFTSSGAPVTEFSTHPVTSDLGIAVDASGHVYVDGGGYGGGAPGLERFSESGTPEGAVQAGAFQGVTVDPASQDVYTTQGGELAQYSPGGELVISTFGSGIVNDAWGIAVNEHTSEVYAGTYYGSSVDAFGPEVILADVTTESPSSAAVGHTTASLTGHIDPAGGPSVTECDIEYGPNSEYLGGKVPCETHTPITTPTAVSAKLTGLTPFTTYHYRFAAKNENGVSYGQDQTVEPPAVLEVDTGSPTNIAAVEATLRGSFRTDPEGGETRYYFEWGLSKAYGEKTAEHSNSANGVQEVSTVVDMLKLYTLYHYRIVTTDGLGTTYGRDESFYTEPPGLPSIDETASSSVTPEGAVLEAEVNPSFGPTVIRFQYGTSISYGSRTPPSESIGEDGVDHLAKGSITGLQPATTYHYRVLAVNFSGLATGPDETFNTTGLPTVAATVAAAISRTTATLSAQVKPGFSPTTYRFEYGTGTSYGENTPESASIGSDNFAHEVSASLAGLAPGTTYHYRVLATNSVGTTDGPDETFITATTPEEEPVAPPGKCRKGFVLKHGKCVKKPKPKRKHHKRSVHNAGGR